MLHMEVAETSVLYKCTVSRSPLVSGRENPYEALDHDKPANREEWVLAFVEEHRKLRPETGDKYAKTHAVSAFIKERDMQPVEGAKAWHKQLKGGT